MRVVMVLGLVLFLLAQPAVSQVPDDKLIVPGQRIGKWTLDMTINDLLKINGPRKGFPPIPDVGQSPWIDFASPTYEHLWIPLACFYALTHGRDSQKVIALGIRYPTPREQVCVAGEAYRTAKGPLYTVDALETAYGKATAVTVSNPAWHGGFNTVISNKVGLAVQVWNGSNQVTVGYLVFRPGTAKSIWKY